MRFHFLQPHNGSEGHRWKLFFVLAVALFLIVLIPKALSAADTKPLSAPEARDLAKKGSLCCSMCAHPRNGGRPAFRKEPGL